MKTKCLLLCLLFALFLTVSYTEFSAKAWVGDLPRSECGLTIEQFNQHMTSFEGTDHLDMQHRVYGCRGTVTYAYLSATSITFHRNSDMNENYFRVAPGSPTTIFLAFNQNGNFVNAGSYNNNVDVYQLDTLIGQYNVTFSPDYTGSKYPTGTNPDPEPTPTCGPFDVLCWFSSAIGKVVDGFQSLGDLITGLFTSITDFIVNLFMPQNSNGEYTNIVTSGFNTIISTFRERLGFLLYPFDFLLMVNSSVIQGPNVGEVNCESSLGGKLMIPNLLGEEDVRFNVCTIENTPLWQPMTVIIRTAFILAIIFMMYSKYNSITRDREEI